MSMASQRGSVPRPDQISDGLLGSKLRLNLKSRPGAVFQNTTLKVGIGQPHSAFSLPAKSEKADIAKLGSS